MKIGLRFLSLVVRIALDRITALFCHAAMLVGSVFSVHQAEAQWEVRVLAGGGAGRMRTDLFVTTSRGDYQVVDSRFSWLVGGSVTHKLSGPLSFSTGLFWSYIASHDEHWSQGKMIRYRDQQVHYLALPMVVQVEVWRLRLGAGYQLSTPLGGSGTYANLYSAYGFGLEDQIYEYDDLGLKPVDMGVVGELEYRISDRLDAGGRLYYGLLDAKDHSDGFMFPQMNEQLVLTVGYRILPKRTAKAEEAPVQEPVPAQ